MEAHVSKTIIQEGNVVTREKQEALCAAFTNEEIKAAMWSIEENKFPGPDGYSSCFYKKAWPCIGPELCNAVKNFFHTGRLLKQVNATNLYLNLR